MTNPITLRTVLPDEEDTILLIGRRMLATLEEVLGAERAHELYTLEQTVERVRWHLNPSAVAAAVFVVDTAEGKCVGHAIVRIDQDEENREFGLFGTLYVDPAARNQGVATALIGRGEQWVRNQSLKRVATYTDEHNHKLQTLFLSKGYLLSPMPKQFVKLQKELE